MPVPRNVCLQMMLFVNNLPLFVRLGLAHLHKVYTIAIVKDNDMKHPIKQVLVRKLTFATEKKTNVQLRRNLQNHVLLKMQMIIQILQQQ